MVESMAYEMLKLSITIDKFYIIPQEEKNVPVMVIDRISQEISFQSIDEALPSSAQVKPIHGIIGIIRLLAGPYLVVVTKKSLVGQINGSRIWKIQKTEMLSFKRNVMHLNELQMQDNKTYITMVESVLSLDGYYFSYDYDVTHTAQRLHNTSPEFVSMPLHERADPRFLWNGHLLREISQQAELSKFCLPIMHGFISIKSTSVKDHTFQYILISRRSVFRAGVRYYMRGIDGEGHAANSVETEQIIEYNGNVCSYVQTRGSVPFFWSQYPNLKYKPLPCVFSQANHKDGFRKHFTSQFVNYGGQVLVNLLNQNGSEKRLVDGYGAQVESINSDKINYEAFDFHHECSKMRWHRLSILLDRVGNKLDEFKYFMLSKDRTHPQLQSGVFRTNCIDCLDRTNVVQSLFARKSLLNQFITLGILNDGEIIEEQKEFEYLFRNVWADNADACAKQYSGTGALKTDYTRNGRRSIFGALKDGYNSAMRYYLNNFHDGFKQDAIDLFLGNHIVEEDEISPFKGKSSMLVYALPSIFLVAFSMCFVSIIVPDENPMEQFMYIALWGIASVASLMSIFYHGKEFVDKPKLSQTHQKID